MPRRSRRWLWWGLAASALFAGALIAAFLLVTPVLRALVVREGKRHGVELELGELAWGFGWLRLQGVGFALIDVHTIKGKLGDVFVELHGTQPNRIQITGMDVDVTGSLTMLAIELGAFTKNHPEVYELPLSAREVVARWRSDPGAAPWLELSHGMVTRSADGGSFVAEGARVAGVSTGKLGAAWTAQQSFVALGLGDADLGKAPITLRVEHALAEPVATIELTRTRIEKLSRALAVSLPLPTVEASGKLRLVFPRSNSAGPVHGTLDGRLDGFVPPHPPELDGFVFGSVTELASELELSADYTRAKLTNTRVSAGAFKLAGGGDITRSSDHAQIALELRGNLPCGALASAALGSRLGRTVGPLLGQAAREFLSGSVAVTVKVDADSRDLPNARLQRIIGIGCGLRPLHLPAELTLPKLPPLPSGLPPLPSGLPPLPSALPPLPRVPSAFTPPGFKLPPLGIKGGIKEPKAPENAP